MEGVDRTSRGFTLLELLVVVAILGLLAGLAIPSLLGALERGRQKRSMADLRSLAIAISSYATDFARVPEIGHATADNLESFLAPTYLRHVPVDDGWSRPFRYQGSGLDYTVLSLGADGVADAGAPRGATTTFDADIILYDGRFTQWPEGVQTR
jgi:general secretion pathway protein G